MNFELLAPLLVTAIVAIAGWFAVHYFSARRDRRNKLVDLRTEFLVAVHRRLERSVGKTVTRASADDIETALADLQLMGSPEQARLAREFIKAWGGRQLQGINIGLILEELRNSLRRDLGLAPISEPIDHFRLHVAEESPGSASAQP